ncbi:MAG: hypothetical protein PVJ67_05980 [Candidatus Pacearchaeota archaeon]|jgi:hypothetical protein
MAGDGVLEEIPLVTKGFSRDGLPASSENLVYVELFRRDNSENNYVMQPVGWAKVKYSPDADFNPSFFRVTLGPRDKNDSRFFIKVGVVVDKDDYTFKIYSESKN